MSTYSQRQIMLSFAYAAYIDNLLLTGTPSLDAQIGSDITTALSASASTPIPPVAGAWSIVWGPVTYTVPGSLYQDNLMYVVQLNGASPAQYAVAVRGTNGQVLLDWLLEDFDIVQMMPWPPGATGSAVVGSISESTSIGLSVLLSMESGGQTLMQFLTSAMTSSGGTAKNPASVCFTGHSLGAALATTLALYMLENQATWDPDTTSIVTTIAFAGPTAGDQAFAAYFDQQFGYSGTSPLPYWVPGDSSSPSYADCVRTSYDIAPLVWNATTMGNIEDIYKGHGIHDILAPLGTSEIIGYIVNGTSANQYTQIQASQPTVPGTFVDQSDLPPVTSYAWVNEAIYQHHCSYPLVLNVPALTTLLPDEVSCST